MGDGGPEKTYLRFLKEEKPKEVLQPLIDRAIEIRQATDDVDRILIGSSDISTLLGLNKWGELPADRWTSLMGLRERYSLTATNRALRRGRIVETGIIEEWKRIHKPVRLEYGPKISDEGAEPPIVAFDGWRAMRPDAVAVMEDGQVVFVEAKTTRDWSDWGLQGTSDVPLYYACQVGWQFGVARDAPVWRGIDISKVSRIDVSAFCTMDDDFRDYPCYPNKAVNGLKRWMTQWMLKHIWADVPRPPHLPGINTISEIFSTGGRDKGELLPAQARDLELLRVFLEAESVKKLAEKAMMEVQAEIRLRIGNAYGISGVATCGYMRGAEDLSVKDLLARHPEVYKTLKDEGLIKPRKDSRPLRMKRPPKPKKTVSGVGGNGAAATNEPDDDDTGEE